ncbi:MAG: hypothetical protein K6G70_06605 [Bacteroidaceae bacterium]|nr:hypothetical protein [Bacteroidaceae bacterium]
MADTIYISRPKTKPSSSTKGKLNEWDNGYKEFVPAGTRESNRQMLKQMGDNSFYLNQGKKESSYSLHLNVDGESQDPVAEMFDIFMHLTEDQRKALPKLPEGSQGRMLLDNGSLKIWLDSERGKLSILTQLECSAQIERQLLQAQAQMNVCIGRYRQDIINANNNK